MTGTLAKLALFWTVLLGVASHAEVVRIDFGTPESPVKQGHLGVSPDTTFGEGVKVGWLSAGDLTAVDRPIPRVPFPPVIYTNEWRQDSVQGRKTATLRVAVPEGDYRVWIMAGPGGGARSQVWDITVQNKASSVGATYYTENSCRSMTMDAVSDENGHLDLTVSTRSKWALNAMVIGSVDEWPMVRDGEVAKMEQEAFLLPDDVLKNWKHTPHVDNTPPPEYTATEKKRGFIIYRKPWVTNVWPNTVPRREEFNPILKAFASPNEYEPVTFTVMPLRDFERAMVSVTDLRTADGFVIPASDIEVRYVQYKWVRPNYKVFGRYYRAPDLLPLFKDPRPLKAGENFRVWLTVNVRPYVRDGTYRGQVRLELDGKQAAKVTIMFRVLPIMIEKDLSITYGTYYKHPSVYIHNAPDGFSRRWWIRKVEKDFESMAAHGYNAFVNKIGASRMPDGTWRAPLDWLETNLEIARSHGFHTWKPVICQFTYPLRKLFRRHVDGGDIRGHLRGIKMPPQAFFDDVTAMVEAIEAERRRRNLPEILYYPIDEPGTAKNSMDFMVAIFKAIKKVPGVRIYVTADPSRPGFAPMRPYVDVWCSNLPTVSIEQQKADRARGIEHYWYPNRVAGENDHTTVAGARMTYGFGRWRTGYKVLTPWRFEAFSGAPENYLDSVQMDFFNQTDDDAGVLPCNRYEAYREGIDDGRYLTTLEQWINRVRALGYDKAADEAAADLKAVWDSITVDPPPEAHGDIATWGWSEDSLDVYRWILATRIMKLQKLYRAR